MRIRVQDDFAAFLGGVSNEQYRTFFKQVRKAVRIYYFCFGVCHLFPVRSEYRRVDFHSPGIDHRDYVFVICPVAGLPYEGVESPYCKHRDACAEAQPFGGGHSDSEPCV